MISFLTALLTMAILSLPGWILALRGQASLGLAAAAGVGSIFTILLVSALIGEVVGPLPAWSILVVGTLMAFAVLLIGKGPVHLPKIEWVQLVFPLFCAGVGFAAYSFAFQTGDDPLIYRSWYNADWFKHLGHANAAANFGFPVPDIFAGLGRLHYYWLFYLLPGASASLHGDVQGAMIATNVIVIFLFWLLLQELLKSAGISSRLAALLAFVGWAINSISAIGLVMSYQFDFRRLLDERSIDPGMLMEVNSYIPQHVTMLCGLLAFLILFLRGASIRYRYVLALAPVIAAGATSTLLGASVVAVCCSVLLFFAPHPFLRRAALAIGTGLAALAIVFLLQVVLPGADQGSLGSPVFESGSTAAPMGERLTALAIRLVATLSLALPLGLIGIALGWRRDDEAQARFALIGGLIFAIGLGATLAASILLDDARLAGEIALRNKYLLVIGLLVGIAFLVGGSGTGGRERRSIGLAIGVMVILALPTVVLNFFWLGWSGPRWQLEIPGDDMEALTYLRTHAERDALVLQYPEPVSFLMGGRDTWVPIFAGRAVPGSYRSTRWAESGPVVAAMERFYAGEADADPGADIDWIYLSRTLHPDSYDGLAARLEADADWSPGLVLPRASLFVRAELASDEGAESE